MSTDNKDAVSADALDSALYDAMAGQLSDLYSCGRVWSAWSYGTMTEDDFTIASEDEDIIANFVNAARSVLAISTPSAPDCKDCKGDQPCEKCQREIDSYSDPTADRDAALEEAAALCNLHAKKQATFHQHAEMYVADFCATAIRALKSQPVQQPGGVRDDGLAEFTAYVVKNYPADTIVGDPSWHAPRLFRAAQRALVASARPSAPQGKQAHSDLTTGDCPICNGKGIVGGHRGQTPESYEEVTEGCDECHGQGKIIVVSQPAEPSEVSTTEGDSKIIAKQVASWRKEVARLNDMIATAVPGEALDESYQDAATPSPQGAETPKEGGAL